MTVFMKRRAGLSLIFLLMCSTFANGELLTGLILDSELQIPVKNVTVTLENIEVTTDEQGEFTIDMDQVATMGVQGLSTKVVSVYHRGSQKELQVSFPTDSRDNAIEIRNIKGVSLFKEKYNSVSSVTVPLKQYADGMYVLTVHSAEAVEHYWIAHTSRNSASLGETLVRAKVKSEVSSQKRAANSNDETLHFVCVKPGYDTLMQDITDFSETVVFRMDRFEYCGNDVTEGDEQCDGDDAPCNVIAPLQYALGESSCNTLCEGYIEDDCVPHPNTNVSGNSNGEDHKTALDMTSMAQFNILQAVQVGMIEGNFHDIIDSVFDANGANGLAFNHITGSGPNSIILHYEGKNRVLEDGDVLLVDIGAKYNGYCADITRTYPVNGSFSDRQREVYQLVLDAKEAAAAEMVPGVHSLNQMTTFVKDFFRASPLRAKDKYGREQTMDKFFVHGLCHYVGKNVHGQDLPFNNSEPVQPGRIFTIEPGLYIESEGFGIRLEDTYIMSSTGAENIMPNLPIDADHIEAIMAARKLTRSSDSYRKQYEPVKSRSNHMDF